MLRCARNDVEVATHTPSSSPAKAGDPVRRGLSVLSLLSLEYWVPRLRGGRRLGVTSQSRGTLSPRFAINFPPSDQRAQGRPGACCTRGLVCCLRIARAAHEHTGQREHSGLPCAMALRLTSCSSRRTALLPPLSQRSFASPGRNASTATSEPHDFAVRSSHTRQSQLSHPSHLTARS